MLYRHAGHVPSAVFDDIGEMEASVIGSSVCNVCFRKCNLDEGQLGACKARIGAKDGAKAGSEPINYGQLTSLALDPIEKKPLSMFYPGSYIVSVGSFGCNLKCPFCQNSSISLSDGASKPRTEYCTPEELCAVAVKYVPQGNIGVAFTYNEPLVGYEFVRDTARLIHEAGLKNVIVTNGSTSDMVLDEILPLTDAMNIDLKCFNADYYKNVLKGDFEATKNFIRRSSKSCHVELTTLIIPDENDSEEEMRELASWVHETEEESGKSIPLHVTRFFPRSDYSDRQPTPVDRVYRLAEVAREKLKFVFEGNC